MTLTRSYVPVAVALVLYGSLTPNLAWPLHEDHKNVYSGLGRNYASFDTTKNSSNNNIGGTSKVDGSVYGLPPSPAGLLKPDGFLFYTYNERGDMITKRMTMEEIQSLIAAGGPEHSAVDLQEAQVTNDGFTDGKKVIDVVQKVQSVLKSALGRPSSLTGPVTTIPETVNAQWSYILPAILAGESGTQDNDASTRPSTLQSTKNTSWKTSSTTELSNSDKQDAPESNSNISIESVLNPNVLYSEKPMIPVPVITSDEKQHIRENTESPELFSERVTGKLPTIEEIEEIEKEATQAQSYLSVAIISANGSSESTTMRLTSAVVNNDYQTSEVTPALIIVDSPTSTRATENIEESTLTSISADLELSFNSVTQLPSYLITDVSTFAQFESDRPLTTKHDSTANFTSTSASTTEKLSSTKLFSTENPSSVDLVEMTVSEVFGASSNASHSSTSSPITMNYDAKKKNDSTGNTIAISTSGEEENTIAIGQDRLESTTLPSDHRVHSFLATSMDHSNYSATYPPSTSTQMSAIPSFASESPQNPQPTRNPLNPISVVESILESASAVPITDTTNHDIGRLPLPDFNADLPKKTLASSLIAGFQASSSTTEMVRPASPPASESEPIATMVTERITTEQTYETVTDGLSHIARVTVTVKSELTNDEGSAAIVSNDQGGATKEQGSSISTSKIPRLPNNSLTGTIVQTTPISDDLSGNMHGVPIDFVKYNDAEKNESLVLQSSTRPNDESTIHHSESGSTAVSIDASLNLGIATTKVEEVTTSEHTDIIGNSIREALSTTERAKISVALDASTTQSIKFPIESEMSDDMDSKNEKKPSGTEMPILSPVTRVSSSTSMEANIAETATFRPSGLDVENGKTQTVGTFDRLETNASTTNESTNEEEKKTTYSVPSLPTTNDARQTTEKSSGYTEKVDAVNLKTKDTADPGLDSDSANRWQLVSLHEVVPSLATYKPVAMFPTPNGTEWLKHENSANGIANGTTNAKGTEVPPESGSPNTANIPNITNAPVPLAGAKGIGGLDTSVRNTSTDILHFSKLCNELAFKYWVATNKGLSTSRSLALSPFGMISLLAMIFLGARGSTSDQMNEVLGLDNVATFNPHLIFQNVTDAVSLARQQGIANAAFVRELFADKAKVRKLMPFYKEQAQQFYEGLVTEVNFASISDLARRRTNLLIRKQTGGRIKDFVKSNAVPLRSPLSAISANVFQTDCNSSMASTAGRDGEFYFAVSPAVRLRKLIPVPATVWRSNILAGYEASLDATAVALGEQTKLVSTIFLMPGEQGHAAPGDTLDRLEQRLVNGAFRDGAWDKILKILIPRPGLELQLPKFSHRSVVNATAALKRMGLDQLFSGHADLKGINGVGNRLHLTDVLQLNLFSTCGEESVGNGRHHVETYPTASAGRNARRYVEEEEEEEEENNNNNNNNNKEPRIFLGKVRSNRAFLRDRLIKNRSFEGLPPGKTRLKLDQPFLYFVRHNPTGLILHMGRFNPRLLP